MNVLIHYGVTRVRLEPQVPQTIEEQASEIMQCGSCRVHRKRWAAAEYLASAGRGTVGEPRGDWRTFTPSEG
jgi:hypothetical protein